MTLYGPNSGFYDVEARQAPGEDARFSGPYEGEYLDPDIQPRWDRSKAETIKDELFKAKVEAKRNLVIVSSFLVTEAIGEGDPGRDITQHPDYIAALDALTVARNKLNAYITNSYE